MLTLAVALFVLFCAAPAAKSARPKSFPMLRAYAHQLVVKRWHSEAEWVAFEHVIDEESGFNPCAVYPGRRDCSYSGSNSCGIAQRNPCPRWMRGRLWETRWAQIRDAVAYMAARYGSPSRTWAHWQVNRAY